MGERFEDLGHGERVVEEDEALAHLNVVRLFQTPVQFNETAEEFAPVVAILDQGHGHAEGVREHAVHIGLERKTTRTGNNKDVILFFWSLLLLI